MGEYHPAPNGSMPIGAKLWLLNLGGLDVDDGVLVAGRNSFPPDAPATKHARRKLVMISIMVYYPGIGLILYDTGSPEDVIANWDLGDLECTPRIWEKATNGLPEAIAATGNKIEDVKIVIMSHLHMDHAGGLEHFMGTDTEIWCHEAEFKNAFWQYATGMSRSLFRPHYLTVTELKWKTFDTPTWPLLPGITLHRCPGHTDGLIIAEIKLPSEGTVVLTGDLMHVAENWEEGIPQGTLITDFTAWHRSRMYVRNLVERRQAQVVLGHDPAYFEKFTGSATYKANGYAN